MIAIKALGYDLGHIVEIFCKTVGSGPRGWEFGLKATKWTPKLALVPESLNLRLEVWSFG